MDRYDTARWHDLFVASSTAAAALAGLIFVSVSINIGKIIELKGAPERGLQTVLVLLGSLNFSLCCLIPQSAATLGWELLATSGVLLFGLALLAREMGRAVQGHPAWVAARALAPLPGSVPFFIGGASLTIHAGGGLV